jgi:hypothetical protein
MVSFPIMKIPNVGVALALICVVTLALGEAAQAPVVGLVSHTDRLSGTFAPPVSAVIVIAPLLPTLDVATAKTPTREFGSRVATPSCVIVAASAIMSGTGVVDADSKSVLMPVITVAGGVLAHAKLSCTSVGTNAAVGVKANTKV